MIFVCGVISVIVLDFFVKFDKLLFWNGKIVVLDKKSVKSIKIFYFLVNKYRFKIVFRLVKLLGYSEVFVRFIRF